ncbi:phage holin family protein [bacterium]|nr:phage holin family protein [bacterium]
MNIIMKWLIATLAILISSYLVPGVLVSGIWTALWVALFLGLFNVSLKPVLVILTLPINILTFRLFIFVINTLLILLISTIIKGFEVNNFLSALTFSIFLSLISYLLNYLIKTNKS